ncbi:MAG: hypothetical protein H0U59_09190 [Gemmatimonadaceae bacterium]|nr:hypothetical protein [Gemmatimonadaceae bacterium]
MTTCAECLSAISTSSLSQLGPGSEVAVHCETCGDCSRTAYELRYAEYRLAAALNEMKPRTGPVQIADTAQIDSELLRRRRIGKLLRLGLAAALVVTAWVGVEQLGPRLQRGSPGEIETETMELSCLTPTQASELVTPYLRSNGAAVYLHEQPRAITMRGIHRELEQARSQLIHFEHPPGCSLPANPGSGAADASDPPRETPATEPR